MLKSKLFISFLVLLSTVFTYSQRNFIHPGILHSAEDLERMKTAVAQKQEPIYSGYLKFIENPASNYTYKMQGPMEMVGRNPTIGQREYDADANAAHQNAIMWCITGDKRYADKAIEIVNAWSHTLKSITGKDAVLMAGLGPFKMVNAAEILRYTHTGWAETDIRQTERHFKEVIYPVIKNFAPFANGNWDAAAIKTMMAIAVFCNDTQIFDKAITYYVNGHGNGCITNYIINASGQIQESGRDQAHTQLGVAMLAECSEIAWHQGLDLYAYKDNLLLKGFEYVAKFNLGNDDVPFSPWLDRTGKYNHKQISQQVRNNLRAVYEQILNHYTHQMGIAAPYVKLAAEKLRPEGPGNPGADHPGYGTLYFSRPNEDAVKLAQNSLPSSPAGVIATSATNGLHLQWVAVTAATSYLVKRATMLDGNYTVLAKISTTDYVDVTAEKGEVYFYTVSAINDKGESPDASIIPVSVGLPAAWQEKTIGNTTLKGHTRYDGHVFNIEAAGMGVDSVYDSFQYVYFPLKADAEITVRYVPQLSSQFTQFGLMLRGGLTPDNPHVALMVKPGKSQSIEAPDWHVCFLNRKTKASNIHILNKLHPLQEGVVTNGRLTSEYWLRLQLKGNKVVGYVSTDGKNWQPVGKTVFKIKKAYLGIAVSSGIETRTTNVRFDNVVSK